MASTVGLRVRIIPWDDSDFVHAVEAARDQAHAEGLLINGPRGAARAEQHLRAAGYPKACVNCDRTVEEAMAHAAIWTVRRDGPEA
jgi:hypothetical protein